MHPFFLSVHFISYGGAFLHFIKKRTDNLFPLSFGNRMVFKFRKRRPNMRKGMLGRISKTGIDSREKAPPRRLETCDRQIRFGE